jgi:hypothetical protein
LLVIYICRAFADAGRRNQEFFGVSFPFFSAPKKSNDCTETVHAPAFEVAERLELGSLFSAKKACSDKKCSRVNSEIEAGEPGLPRGRRKFI